MSDMSTATATAPVKTSKVAGRRELHFTSLDDILADAQRLAAGPVRQLGNWSLGQATTHLARTMKMSLDGVQFRAPWYIRMVAPLIKKKMLRDTMRPGFKLPSPAADELIPAGEVSIVQGLTELRTAIDRLHREPQRAPSPVFGAMTREEWDQLHQRHAELHFSFFVPQ
jgi:hypothetical protein